MEISKLRTEYQDCPLGLDEALPRFSWELQSEEKNTFQSAYRIQIKTDENGEMVWDSGKCISGRSLGIVYGGSPLQACTRYQVQVQVWNQADGRAHAAGWFETGLMNADISAWDVPRLDIYRVGYAPEDDADKPFASVILKDGRTGKLLINDETKEQFHTLTIEVTGNQAKAYFDQVQVDGQGEGGISSGRLLNPRGVNDVLTYPRLNRIGFFAGKEGKVYFRSYIVSNLRAPYGTFVEEKAGHGLYGRKSIFDGLISVEQDCFVLQGGQVTADPSNTSMPMLRRVFHVGSGLKRARLYITARGIYDCRINAVPVNNSLLAPGLTQYDRRISYQTYDITDYLQEGDNGIGIILSSGWWSDAQTFTVANYNYFGDRAYEYGGLFMGEQYRGDKEEEIRSFSRPDYAAEGWECPIVYAPVMIEATDAGFARKWPAVNVNEPLIAGGYDAPVSVVARKTAHNRMRLRADAFIYDFGQEMAGVPEITFHEKKGQRIVIQYGEMLYPDLPAYAGKAGKLMRENYRDAESTDIYICRGDASGETYRPRFTFHGFRYIQLTGVTVPPKLAEVKALQYSSVREFQGSFYSEHELLNRFMQNVKWSQLCNFINIPTDCPQRNERMGWAGAGVRAL